MFKPILSDSIPLPSQPPRWHRWYRLGRGPVIALIAAFVVLDLILLGSLAWDHAGGRRRGPDITQQVSVVIESIDPTKQTIRVAGDLVGIMGIDVVVTPQTWIGVDRQLAVFGELRDGLRANISFVLEGEQRIARWIAASSPNPFRPGVADAEPAPRAGVAEPPSR